MTIHNPTGRCAAGHPTTFEPEIGQGNGAGSITCYVCFPWHLDAFMARAAKLFVDYSALRRRPSPMRLNCPACKTLHVDQGEFATKPHHTHSCQHCGLTWRPAVVATVGVRFLPGLKD